MRRNRIPVVFAILLSMSVVVFWLGNVLADATIEINDGLTVAEGSVDNIISSTVLSATDGITGSPTAILTYTLVTTPANGELFLNGTLLTPTGIFRQADINSDFLTYDHDGSETLSDSFEFTVATSNTIPITDVFSIIITAVNEPPTISGGPFAIAENASINTPVGTVITSDVDVGDTFTYTITASDPAAAFAIGSSSGTITVSNSSLLDFETTPTFTLTVQIEDSGTLTDTADIVIDLINANDPPTLADATLPDLPEDSPAATLVGTVTATDPDAGDSLTYSITAGNPGPTFVIDPNNGNITVANTANLDFETMPTYTLTVQVEDNGAPTLSDTAEIVINLSNVNEAPTINDDAFTVPENSPNTTAVGTVVGSDPDASETLTYSITASDPAAAFAIGSSSGAITVSDSNLLDFETTPTFTLTVEVEDSGSLVDTAEIVIDLNDLNDEIPIVIGNTFNLNENSANGTAVGTAIGSDPDAVDMGNLTFGILSGNTGGAFAIANDGSNNGAITVANINQLDYEINQSFTLGIVVTDTGNLSSTANVTININNLFDESPTANDATFFVAEGSADGVVVGIVSATDPEFASGDSLTYEIFSGNTGNVFTINSSNGQITVPDVSKLDSSSMPIFNLTVTVTDLGNNPDTATITINVSPLPITFLYLPAVLNNYPPIEPNNNCGQSFGIGTGTNYEFTADDTEDWYAVTLSSPGNLLVTLSSFEPAQGQLIVYAGPCSSLTALQNDGSSSTTKVVNLTGLAAGTYYIRVFSAPITNTTYTLRVN